MRAFLIPLALVVSACATQPPSSAVTSPTPASPTVTIDIEQTAAFRTACATSVLSSFVAAFNRGDDAQLRTFFSATDGRQPFQWFYTPETPAYGPDLERLGEHLAAWHAAGERWRVVSVQTGDGPSWHGGVDFALKIERVWSDRSEIDEGKGALDCTARKIFAFGIGGSRTAR